MYRSFDIPSAPDACYGRGRMRGDDHHPCEERYEELRNRLHAATERIEQLEENQRTILDLLRDFRHLVRAITTRLTSLDERIEKTLARLHPLREAGERIARHFRN